jgi:hypothetical protein
MIREIHCGDIMGFRKALGNYPRSTEMRNLSDKEIHVKRKEAVR